MAASVVRQLQEVESRAKEIIAAARLERSERMKRATEEAESEIREFERQQRDALRRAHPEDEVQEERERELVIQTDRQIELMRFNFKKSRAAALDLLERVITNTDRLSAPKA